MLEHVFAGLWEYVMTMLTCKEVPCVENVHIAYCVNCRNIPG